jgi:hypothetical protein
MADGSSGARDAAADAHVAMGPRWADLTPPGTVAAALGPGAESIDKACSHDSHNG